MKKNKKQKLYLIGYEKNPHGKETPIYSTVEPVKKVKGSRLPGARKKGTE